MTDKLPPQLLALFAPRPPLRWVGHTDEAPEHRRTAHVSGLAEYLPALQAYKDNDGYVPTESWLQMRDRKKREAEERRVNLMKETPKNCGFPPCRYPVFLMSTFPFARSQADLD